MHQNTKNLCTGTQTVVTGSSSINNQNTVKTQSVSLSTLLRKHSTSSSLPYLSLALCLGLPLSRTLTKWFPSALFRWTTHPWLVNQSPRPGHLTVPMTTHWKPATLPSSPPTVSRVRSNHQSHHNHLIHHLCIPLHSFTWLHACDCIAPAQCSDCP